MLNSASNITAIDLFAGLGGFTEAAEQAGIRVVWAANHWQAAVDVHRLNHPAVEHSCQDLHQADWELVPRHEVLLASPCCQGHSKARGKDRPHSDKSRSTAWAVVSCAEFHRPFAIVVENVPEFRQWALYDAWLSALHALGYRESEHVFDAADAGIPQHRLRWLCVLTRSRSPLIIQPPQRQHVAADTIINWDAGRWSQVDRVGRAAATLQRIRHGRSAFGDRFLISYYGNTKTGRSIERPIGTITTRDRWAVIRGNEMRMLSAAECRRAMGFRDSYRLPTEHRLAVHMLGNAVPPGLAAHVLQELQRAA